MVKSHWYVMLDHNLVVKKIYHYVDDSLLYSAFIGDSFWELLGKFGYPWSEISVAEKDFDNHGPSVSCMNHTDELGQPCQVNLVVSPVKLPSSIDAGWAVYGFCNSFSNQGQAGIDDMQARHVLTHMPGYVYWKNKSSVYLGCNNNFARVAGLNKPQDIVGKTDYDLPWAKTEAELFRQGDRMVLNGEELVNFEEPQLQSNGKEVVVLATKKALLNEKNEPCGVIGVYTDISDRKKQEQRLGRAVEEARQVSLASQSKSDFIANMGHDVRTPLSGIIGLADNLHRILEDKDSKQMARDIYNASGQLMSFCDEILEVAEIDSGLIQTSRSVFSLQDFIDNVCSLMRASAKHKHLKFGVIYDCDLSGTFIAPRALLRRVLANLLSNAIKFTDKGGVTVRANIVEELASGEATFHCSITDTGPGIPVEGQQRVFECFNRGASAYSDCKGTGLGLHIVKKFIEQMDGKISLTSKVGEGSCFKLSIPIKRVQANPSLGKKDVSSTAASKGDGVLEVVQAVQGMPVLLVEDDPLSQKVGALIIGKIGCQIDIAKNGTEALSMFKQKNYSCVFLDIGLPDIGGVEVMEKIRQQHRPGQRPSFIAALTAHISRKEEPDLIRRGFNQVLRKPITQQAALMACCAFLEADPDAAGTDEVAAADDIACVDNKPATSIARGGERPVATENDLLLMLIEDVSQQWPHIKKAYQSRDYNKLAALIHRLRGGAGYVDLPDLYDAVKQLDEVLASKNYDDLERVFSAFASAAEDLLACSLK